MSFMMNGGYRKNVGLVLIKNKLIFAGFRSDLPENDKTGWQMPQGGIEEGEDILQAGYRELYEETGITKDKVKIIAQMPNTIKYDFPDDVINKMYCGNKIVDNNCVIYKGQEQYWIVLEFFGEDSDVNLKPTSEPQEFSKWGWKTVDFLIKNVYEMKKTVYKQLFAWMRDEKII